MNIQHLIHEISQRMLEKGIGQKRLAVSAGLNETYVRDVLKGKSKRPDVFSIGRLAQVLDCSIEELIGFPTFKSSQVTRAIYCPEMSGESLYTMEELAVIDLWRSLLPNQREHLIGLLEAMADRRVA